MKLALLATMVTFAGSIAGFQAVSAGSPPPEVAASPAAVESVVVQGSGDRDCPWARPADADEA